jgi:hypothetical protein
MPLSQYLKSFSRLRTDKNRKRWSALTTIHFAGKTGDIQLYLGWVKGDRSYLEK